MLNKIFYLRDQKGKIVDHYYGPGLMLFLSHGIQPQSKDKQYLIPVKYFRFQKGPDESAYWYFQTKIIFGCNLSCKPLLQIVKYTLIPEVTLEISLSYLFVCFA